MKIKKGLAGFVAALVITGCTPTLQHQKAGAQAVQTEAAMQTHLAAQLRLKRVKRLAGVANRLKVSTNKYCRRLETKKSGCSFPVMLSDGQNLNAQADGKRVYIHAGMMRFVESDDELAYVVGHELAHNVLEHSDKKRGNAILGGVADVLFTVATGVSSDGAFSKAGARAYSQAFESEADYLGMYIAADSGYDISSAPLFWRKMAVESPGGIAQRFNSTHPSTPERFVALSQTLDEIQGKLDMGLVLAPNQKGGGGNEDAEEAYVARDPAAPTERAALVAEVADSETVVGPQNYGVSKLAQSAGCLSAAGLAPRVSMLNKTGPVENYEASCYGATAIQYRCEWQDCRVVER